MMLGTFKLTTSGFLENPFVLEVTPGKPEFVIVVFRGE